MVRVGRDQELVVLRIAAMIAGLFRKLASMTTTNLGQMLLLPPEWAADRRIAENTPGVSAVVELSRGVSAFGSGRLLVLAGDDGQTQDAD
jgi:hypothetical protein